MQNCDQNFDCKFSNLDWLKLCDAVRNGKRAQLQKLEEPLAL